MKLHLLQLINSQEKKWHYNIVFYLCSLCNKVPQTWWFKTIKIYSLTVLETRSQK